MSPQGHLLYNAIAELISAHLESETREKIVPVFPQSANAIASSSAGQAGTSAAASENIAAAAAGQLFLDRVRDVWEDHIACMSKLRDVLKYLVRSSLGLQVLAEVIPLTPERDRQDKVWTNPSNGIPAVFDLGLSLFFHHVILFSTNPKPPTNGGSHSRSSVAPISPSQRPTADPACVAHHLISTLLNVIRIEREGEVVSRSAIDSTVKILSRLTDEGAVPLPVQASQGTGSGSPVVSSSAANARARTVMGEGPPGAKESAYKTAFEQAFLRQTEEFYRLESARLLLECDCPSFLKRVRPTKFHFVPVPPGTASGGGRLTKAYMVQFHIDSQINRRLEEESTRAQSYLGASTEPLLISLLDNVLIEQHLSSILEHPASGLPTLIQDSRVEDLKLMYTLFGRVGKGHAALQKGISAWIVGIGKQVNEGVSLSANPPPPTGDLDDASKSKAAGNEDEEPGAAGGGGGATGKKPAAPAGGPINAKTKAALAWVQDVLDLKDKFDLLLEKAFAGDKAFEKSINDVSHAGASLLRQASYSQMRFFADGSGVGP